ncbi:hypothetical protein I7I50_02706 [Histoplasma capsulatum G186AR]|uniref:Uncharacterized protein n=1 Tax=Ajellomyces capsulatus TaxID=5037 RepID=A0A8H7Z4Y2_AJECA|nr:hypothetical protein I7I52_00628 [Histoplasma capsulatum]QSS71744.1 hypothetical protein I7I50_02706 [Histoplasma capsulatum G186AR]
MERCSKPIQIATTTATATAMANNVRFPLPGKGKCVFNCNLRCFFSISHPSNQVESSVPWVQVVVTYNLLKESSERNRIHPSLPRTYAG